MLGLGVDVGVQVDVGLALDQDSGQGQVQSLGYYQRYGQIRDRVGAELRIVLGQGQGLFWGQGQIQGQEQVKEQDQGLFQGQGQVRVGSGKGRDWVGLREGVILEVGLQLWFRQVQDWNQHQSQDQG